MSLPNGRFFCGKNMKTVGIIGGLGPETTANFFLEVLSLCFKTNKIRRPSMLIHNVPMFFKLEENFIKHSVGKKQFSGILINSAKMLEKGGADFIVIPCNTAHIFIEEIRKSVNIPVLSIVEETVDFLEKNNKKKIGLLATPATVRSKLFDDILENNGIKIDLPEKSEQDEIGVIVNKILKNNHTEKDKLKLLEIVNNLSDEDAIVLACTDLHILIPPDPKRKIFDTMHILAISVARKLKAN